MGKDDKIIITEFKSPVHEKSSHTRAAGREVEKAEKEKERNPLKDKVLSEWNKLPHPESRLSNSSP